MRDLLGIWVSFFAAYQKIGFRWEILFLDGNLTTYGDLVVLIGLSHDNGMEQGMFNFQDFPFQESLVLLGFCLLYTSDAADE